MNFSVPLSAMRNLAAPIPSVYHSVLAANCPFVIVVGLNGTSAHVEMAIAAKLSRVEIRVKIRMCRCRIKER